MEVPRGKQHNGGCACRITHVMVLICRGFPPESFDYILLDAPCTGLGLRPRLLQRQSIGQLRSAAHYQRKLLDVAVALLKPGGEMVYSTCSINPGDWRKPRWIRLSVQLCKLTRGSKFPARQGELCGAILCHLEDMEYAVHDLIQLASFLKSFCSFNSWEFWGLMVADPGMQMLTGSKCISACRRDKRSRCGDKNV